MNPWIIIPARGGSRTIPRKNLAPLAGRPLIDYVLLAARAWEKAERIIVSTDDKEIGARAQQHGALVVGRPRELAQGDVPIWKVVADALNQVLRGHSGKPEVVVFLQPSYPFVLPEHIEKAITTIKDSSIFNSCQTLTETPHACHEYNQRILIEQGHTFWSHPTERQSLFNKQLKPMRFIFGNLILFRTNSMFAQRTLFTYPSNGIPIPRPYAYDVDDSLDLAMAEAMIEKGIVKLEHLK